MYKKYVLMFYLFTTVISIAVVYVSFFYPIEVASFLTETVSFNEKEKTVLKNSAISGSIMMLCLSLFFLRSTNKKDSA